MSKEIFEGLDHALVHVEARGWGSSSRLERRLYDQAKGGATESEERDTKGSELHFYVCERDVSDSESSMVRLDSTFDALYKEWPCSLPF